MDSILVVFISTIPAGLSTFFLLLLKKKIDQIMIKYNPKYSGYLNNPIDLFRIINVYISGKILFKEEKKILRLALVLFFIGFVTIVFWFVVFFLFPEYILG
jgi:hypothetical protein